MLAAAMLIPMALICILARDWQVFAAAALLTAFVGVAVWLSTSQREPFDLGLKQAFLLTNGAWGLDRCLGPYRFIFGV